VACGNNSISRDYLNSQPSVPASLVNRLFAGGGRELTNQRDPSVYDSRQHSHPFDPKNLWVIKPTAKGVEQLIGKDGQISTGHLHPHIHLIREDGDVSLHITENTRLYPVHSHHMNLPSATPGQVQRAIDELLMVLNDPNRVSRFA
jgi:hypothetical protein